MGVIHVRGAKDQAAALRHGVARIYHQVDDHLLNLGEVRFHRAEVGRALRNHHHIVADQRAQHFFQIVHHRVQIEHARL